MAFCFKNGGTMVWMLGYYMDEASAYMEETTKFQRIRRQVISVCADRYQSGNSTAGALGGTQSKLDVPLRKIFHYQGENSSMPAAEKTKSNTSHI